jgi:cell division protein FtsI (penicillin-binding protein 3)
VATYTVYADPPQMTPAQQQQAASRLAGPLGMTPAAVLNRLQHPTSRDYVVLAKNVPAQASGQISAMGLRGVAMTVSYARSYPAGQVAANLIGFTGENWPGVTAVSRCRPAPTASRSRWRAATTSRW